MSIRFITAAWALEVSSTQKLVLVCLADHADDAGGCWPSIQRICTRTGLGKTAVIEAIGVLEQAGYVNANRSNGRHTTYQLLLQVASKPVRQADRYASRTGSRRGMAPVREAIEPDRQAVEPGRQADTNRQEPSLNRPKEQAEKKRKGFPLPMDWQPTEEDVAFAREHNVDPQVEAAKFRDYWHAIPGAKGRKCDWSATWRNWVRRVKQFGRIGNRKSLAEIELANKEAAIKWASRAGSQVVARDNVTSASEPILKWVGDLK